MRDFNIYAMDFALQGKNGAESRCVPLTRAEPPEPFGHHYSKSFVSSPRDSNDHLQYLLDKKNLQYLLDFTPSVKHNWKSRI